MTNLAYTNTRHRIDWRECYDNGNRIPDVKYKRRMVQLIHQLGMEIDERINIADTAKNGSS